MYGLYAICVQSVLFEDGAVALRSRHFAFHGAALSFLVAAAPAESQLCRCNPAGVYVPPLQATGFLKFMCNNTLQAKSFSFYYFSQSLLSFYILWKHY
ncbi:hypothetical protein B14911_12097 [Bacillus sp. NRRL B-14911]|nr:hypothetical protein B14911_12097 [Bacillus sp. NRRL B-14911]